MKRLFVLFFLISNFAMAGTNRITVVLPSVPGGIYDTQLRAMEKTLRTHGYDVDYEITGSCKGAAIWLKDNPNTPAIYLANTEDEIHRRNHPDSDGACDIGYTQDRLISISLVSRQNVCSMLPPDQAMTRFKAGNFILGTVFPPLNNYYLVTDLIDNLKLNSRVIKYQGNPKLVQALISKDIDFAFFQNVMPARDAGASCFLTLGDKKYAEDLHRISIAKLDPNTKYVDYKAIQSYMGQNVNIATMRVLAVETLKTDPNIQKELQAGHRLNLEISPEQQWRYITDQINKYTK